MKKRKIKLFASLTSLVMVVAVMAVGIWAAQSATASINATATFNATKHVKAEVAITAISLTNATSTNLKTFDAEAIELVSFGTNEESDPVTKTMNITTDGEDINFAPDYVGNVIVSYTLTITNKALETDQYKTLGISIANIATEATEISLANSYIIEISAPDLDLSEDGAYTGTILQTGTPIVVSITLTFDPNRSIADIDLGLDVVLSMS